ncbi:hypothetical protein AKO1_013145 [Acrasis kona]|uniref:Uncharacterized protein n=1 Tax=Acrasis kona TaxID=1008807 RepID=A0AAW2Z092_9EUKA
MSNSSEDIYSDDNKWTELFDAIKTIIYNNELLINILTCKRVDRDDKCGGLIVDVTENDDERSPCHSSHQECNHDSKKCYPTSRMDANTACNRDPDVLLESIVQ